MKMLTQLVVVDIQGLESGTVGEEAVRNRGQLVARQVQCLQTRETEGSVQPGDTVPVCEKHV